MIRTENLVNGDEENNSFGFKEQKGEQNLGKSVFSQREKRFISEIGKQVNQINNLILKAYKGGVKDINVELGTYPPISDCNAPMVHVNRTKPYKVQQESKNTISIIEAISKFPFVKLMLSLNEFIRKQYDGGIKHINIRIFEDDSTGEPIPQIYIGLKEHCEEE